MSVIPLVLEPGERQSVVKTVEDYTRAGGDDGQVILIQRLDPSQFLSTTGDSNITYDLRVGDHYRDHRDRGSRTLQKGEELSLLPGGAIIIKTEESLRLPRSRFGAIIPRVSLLQEGLSNTTSKVDPGYNGHLLVTVFNLGQRVITLKRGQPFCAFYILRVDLGARLYNKPPKELRGEDRLHLWRKMLDYIDKHRLVVTVFLIISTFLLGSTRLAEFISRIWLN